MVSEKTIKYSLDHLLHNEVVHVDLNGSQITLKASQEQERLSLSTAIYRGDNYVPPSVRLCLKPSYAGPSSYIRTTLSLDEENYTICLNHMSSLKALTSQELVRLLEEFSWMAEEWRQVLNDNDRCDLVHIRVK